MKHPLQLYSILNLLCKNYSCNKSFNLSLQDMLDEQTYYIIEGTGYHPSLKSRITNYSKDVPYYSATIFMHINLSNYKTTNFIKII